MIFSIWVLLEKIGLAKAVKVDQVLKKSYFTLARIGKGLDIDMIARIGQGLDMIARIGKGLDMIARIGKSLDMIAGIGKSLDMIARIG